MENIQKLFNLIKSENSQHSKYLDKVNLSDDDKIELSNLIRYYINNNIDLNYQSESYLTMLNDTMKETNFFAQNGHYRYSSFNEVKDKVYFNTDYMKKYMVGLALSSYIWLAHIKIRKFFTEYIDNIKSGKNYLEIGPGHGEFFTRAVKSRKFTNYLGVDLSPTSIELTKDMVSYQVGELAKCCNFLCEDFFSFKPDKNADLIVIGEVLEHVENPLLFLKKSREILSENGEIFATIPINAPAIDHIYLFSHPDDVENLAKDANLKIKQSEYCIANNYSLEKALKFKSAVTMCVVLEKC